MEPEKVNDTSFVLGKLEGMAQEYGKNQQEILITLREIRVYQEDLVRNISDHTQDDNRRFETINVNISEARGQVKGVFWIMGIVTSVLALVIGGIGAAFGKWMNW